MNPKETVQKLKTLFSGNAEVKEQPVYNPTKEELKYIKIKNDNTEVIFDFSDDYFNQNPSTNEEIKKANTNLIPVIDKVIVYLLKNYSKKILDKKHPRIKLIFPKEHLPLGIFIYFNLYNEFNKYFDVYIPDHKLNAFKNTDEVFSMSEELERLFSMKNIDIKGLSELSNLRELSEK